MKPTREQIKEAVIHSIVKTREKEFCLYDPVDIITDEIEKLMLDTEEKNIPEWEKDVEELMLPVWGESLKDKGILLNKLFRIKLKLFYNELWKFGDKETLKKWGIHD